MIEVPYKTLFAKLKPEVQGQAARQPKSGENLRLPVARIRTQLASGSVKVTFRELRQFSPPGIFNQNGHNEEELIELPLSEVLPRMKPTHLVRRSNQKKIEVPNDLDDVFGVGGANLRIAGDRGKAGGGQPKSSASTIAEFKAKLAAQAAAAAQAAPTAAPAPAPAPTVGPASPVAPPPISPVAATAQNAGTTDGPIKAPKLDPALAGVKKPARNVLALPLAKIAERWKADGKTQLAVLETHSAELPMEIVEMGLKKGKLVFSWSQFKGWVRAAEGGNVPELAAEEQIDLPLALVAPLFLTQHKPLKKQKKLTLSDEIPDVFGPVKESSAAPAPAPEAKTAPPSPAPAPAPVAANGHETVSSDDFGALLGQPGKTNWNLQELVQGCAKMAGVGGALIGTPDGLLVASAWPAGVKAETVAAFLPQMHQRVNQFSNHLKLGETDDFSLVLKDLPLQVFRTNNSYLIVLGKAGESLPKPQLSAVAQRLSQTTPR